MALDLLDIHIAEDGALTAEKSTTPVAVLLVEVRDHMKPRAELAGQQIEHPEASPELAALLDVDLIRRVLQNLVDNCVKYGRRGGTIWLDAAPVEGGGTPLGVATPPLRLRGSRSGRIYGARNPGAAPVEEYVPSD